MMEEGEITQSSGLSRTESQLTNEDTQNLQMLDLSGIHWGYLNCWQSVARGKKIKTERWFTYWVDLCGNTIRLYKDKSLPPDSSNLPPRPSVLGPSVENEQKVAFFGLRDATVDLLQDGSLYNKKLKQADFTRVFRRHLFQIVFTKLSSTYVFQAPSNSSMLRWVSKIQEAITMSEWEQIGTAAVDERLRLAKFALEQRRWKSDEPQKSPAAGIDTIEEEEEVKKINESMAPSEDPRLRSLKERLRKKVSLLNQLVEQERQFLGGDSEQEVSGKEISGTSLRDYYIVPGRRDTFISKGIKMTLFGQLPDKRWRCWIEIDDLVKSMNSLIAECEENNNGDSKENNGDTRTSLFDQNKQVLGKVPKQEVIDRKYPLIGSVPSSLVEELEKFTNSKSVNKTENETQEDNDIDFVNETPPTSPTCELEVDKASEELPATPYSSHGRRTARKTNSQLSFDSFFFNGETPPNADETPSNAGLTERNNSTSSQRSVSGNFGTFRSSLFYEDARKESGILKNKSPKFDGTGSPSPRSGLPLTIKFSTPISREESPVSSANSSPVMPVKLREGGFVIKKRLRQKGISIIVGSSSSEGESSDNEGDKEAKETNGEQKIETGKSTKRNSTSDFTLSQKDERANFPKEIKQGRSMTVVPGKPTANLDLMDQFGLRSASVSGTPEPSKLFPKYVGPDVKPPRNERRTLKLSKHPDKGYGFYLQTFVFTGKTGKKDEKTFVRYVEEEGPAYMSGLREGDVIVEIEGEDAEKKSHADLVSIIKKSNKELLMVVKFFDAVRRAELSIKLKKRKAKLRSRLKELEELVAKENDISRIPINNPSAMKRSDSATSSGIGLSDDSSENLTSSNEQVIIQTSRFEERCSTVYDSVKAIRYNDIGTPNNNSARTHMTTSSDLLSAFSTDANVSEKPTKSKPVHRSRSFSGSEKPTDPELKKPRGRLNSKDDGFITAAPSLTKSMPPARVISNRTSPPEQSQKEISQKKPLKLLNNSQIKDQIFYDPPKERSGLPIKSYTISRHTEKQAPKDGTLSHPVKSGTLSNPSRDRVLSRNSRPKSYKIAVLSGAEGSRKKVAERVLSYDQLKSRGTPETDL